MGVTYPVCMIEPTELDKLFPTRDVGIPLSILIDDKLRIVDMFEGWSAKTQKRIAALTNSPRLS
jgi:hypothetical protein